MRHMVRPRSAVKKGSVGTSAAAAPAWAHTDAALDLGTLREMLAQHWTDLHDPGADDDGLDPRLAEIRRLQEVLLSRLDSRAESDGRLAEVLGRLDSTPCRTDDIVATVPRLICELGFDRAIVSSIDEGMWRPEAVFVPDEPEWAEAIHSAGRDNPQILGPRLHETEVVRRREGLVVTDAQSDERVNKPIADASLSQSYVAAPIVSDGRVVGLLHADRYRHDGDVTIEDCRLLMAFSQGVRIALSRARLAERMASTQVTLSVLTAAIDATDTRGVDLTSVRSTVRAEIETAAVTRPPSGGAARVTRAGLTSREHEVLALIARGLGNGAIAAELVIAEGTVKQHVKHVLRKLRANNRSEATAMYFEERSTRA